MAEFHSFNEDDFPEVFAKIVQGFVRSQMSTGLAHDVADEEINPSEMQLNIGPGDYVAISPGSAASDAELLIAQVADPEENADTYPDWQDRLLKKYVLVWWRAATNPDGAYGWVARWRLLQIPRGRYEEMLGWLTEEPREDFPPRWLVLLVSEALVASQEANPSLTPELLTCPSCGDHAVTVGLVYTRRQTMAMGVNPEGTQLYQVLQYDQEDESVMELKCWSCDYNAELPQEITLY